MKQEHDKRELRNMTNQVNKVIKDNKLVLPIDKAGFQRLCKGLNMHITERQAFEGLLYCRGKQMENGDPDEFDFDKLVYFLNLKSKFVPPADNPRVMMKSETGRRTGRNFPAQS